MTHQNIELQIAVPKVTEVTKIQQQIQHEQLNQQASLEQMIQKQVERDATRSDGLHESKVVSDEHTTHSNLSQQKKKQKQNKKKYQMEAKHPFKGKKIDLRG